MTDQPMEQYKPAEKLELREIKRKVSRKFLKVLCPACEREVNADNLNLQNSIAKCNNCNVIFSIEDEVEDVKTKKEVKQEILRPEGIELFYFDDDLEITIQQHVQGVDAFGLVFLPIIAVFSIIIFFIGKHPISPYIPILSSLGALFFIYRCLNYSANKTYIDINNKSLSIINRPKNLKKDKHYTVDEIDQLYLKQSSSGTGYYTIYMIINGEEGQTHKRLLTVNTLSKAKYLEQEIERYLHIEDRKVPESDL